jgi:hypothetical protein
VVPDAEAVPGFNSVGIPRNSHRVDSANNPALPAIDLTNFSSLPSYVPGPRSHRVRLCRHIFGRVGGPISKTPHSVDWRLETDDGVVLPTHQSEKDVSYDCLFMTIARSESDGERISNSQLMTIDGWFPHSV